VNWTRGGAWFGAVVNLRPNETVHAGEPGVALQAAELSATASPVRSSDRPRAVARRRTKGVADALADNGGGTTGPRETGLGDSEVTTGRIGTPGEPVMALRGASVEVDVRRVGHAVVGTFLMALAATVIVLFVAGIQKNAQITRLHRQGVAVEVTVSGCLGLMGGSGSNLAGYECKGTFTLDGHRFSDAIPGSTFYSPGTTLRAVAVPDDPALLSTPRDMATEHSSWRVFVLPALLLVILGLIAGAVLVKRGNIGRESVQLPSVTAT
jgi:hypothetical protein